MTSSSKFRRTFIIWHSNGCRLFCAVWMQPWCWSSDPGEKAAVNVCKCSSFSLAFYIFYTQTSNFYKRSQLPSNSKPFPRNVADGKEALCNLRTAECVFKLHVCFSLHCSASASSPFNVTVIPRLHPVTLMTHMTFHDDLQNYSVLFVCGVFCLFLKEHIVILEPCTIVIKNPALTSVPYPQPIPFWVLFEGKAKGLSSSAVGAELSSGPEKM